MWYVSKDTRETWQALTILEGPTDVLIKLNATGICHSDLHFMLNDWALPKMSDLGTRCAGHEGSGIIVKVGDQVKNLKPGMRAGYKVSKPPIISSSVEKGARQRSFWAKTLADILSQSKTLAEHVTCVETAMNATVQRPS
jgi:threonine dehydrogenase-like Zn-dependent dehydrogenase